MPTTLPPSHKPESHDLDGLAADAWAGIAVIIAMFIAGMIYWSGHTSDANATAAPTSQTAGSSAASTIATGRAVERLHD